MKKYRFLPFVLLLTSSHPSHPQTDAPETPKVATPPAANPKPKPKPRWEKQIAAFEAADLKQFPAKDAILFIGSSSIRNWKTLADDFPAHRVINRGFGGSYITDSTRFAERIVWPYQPKMIVLYAGSNDIADKRTPLQLRDDFLDFVAKVREKLPQTRIAFISIAPAPSRWKQVERVKAANALIADAIAARPNLQFIDVFPLMLDEKGAPRPELFASDRLHLSAQGYKLWRETIAPLLPKQSELVAE